MRITSSLVETHIFRYKGNSDDIEFLLLKRSDNQPYPGVWQMVTGKIKENEKAYETALRELKEETGLEPEKFWVVPYVNSFYSHEQDFVCLVPVFAVLVGSNDVKISDEHSKYKWVDKDEAEKLLAWKGQRISVKTIHDYFTKERSFLNFIEIKL